MGYDVTITMAPLRAVIDLKGHKTALSTIAGAALPDLPDVANTMVQGQGGHLALIGPDHWLLIADLSDEGRLIATLRPDHTPATCSIIPISDTLSFLTVTGPDAAKIMAVATPLDLHPSVFGADRLTCTEAFGIKALIRCVKGGFEIGIDRSYAHWFQTMLERTAA